MKTLALKWLGSIPASFVHLSYLSPGKSGRGLNLESWKGWMKRDFALYCQNLRSLPLGLIPQHLAGPGLISQCCLPGVLAAVHGGIATVELLAYAVS